MMASCRSCVSEFSTTLNGKMMLQRGKWLMTMWHAGYSVLYAVCNASLSAHE